VDRLLQCVTCLKHRTLLLTLYAAGLRLSEGAALTIADIDSQRMLLRVACGKEKKERLVPLSPRLLTALRDYWKQVRSPKYLFPGASFDVRVSSTTIQKSCKAAVMKAGILKNVTPHTLRHSYATGLLEAGVDLLTIGHLLGHESFSTTMIYLHVRRPHLDSTPSPIDWLVLHTWNQKLEPHAHVHAVVPGGGPSLQRTRRWVKSRRPNVRQCDGRYLVNADDLRESFRATFLSGLRRLHRRGVGARIRPSLVAAHAAEELHEDASFW